MHCIEVLDLEYISPWCACPRTHGVRWQILESICTERWRGIPHNTRQRTGMSTEGARLAVLASEEWGLPG